MGPPWARAFLVGALLTLLATPFLRRLALATGFVDRPGGHKTHHRPVPYLGGVALIGGVVLGMFLASSTVTTVVVIALGAAVLGAVGLVDDRTSVNPQIRLALQVGMAVLAVVVGLRASATGVAAVDIVITVAWIVGITNAFNLLDNMDGLAAGLAATAAVAVFVLAIMSGQRASAAVAAAVVGACWGFLAYNRRPASIFMGDTGSVFLGFVLAVLTIEVDPALSPPASFAIPMMLLALPVLDTTTVTLARLRRGRSVSIGGRDHLSHRLVALGLSQGAAVGVLVAVEAVLGALAVVGSRRVIPLWTAVLATAVVLAALSAVTSRASVYPDGEVGRWPRWIRPAALGGAGLLVLLAGPALVAVALAEGRIQNGAALADRALASVEHARGSEAAADFARAEASFRKADGRLHGPLASLGLVIPGISSNLAASRELTSIGKDLAAAGGRLTSVADMGQLPVRDGSVSTDDLRRLAPALADATRVLRASSVRLRSVNQPYLVPRLQRELINLSARLATVTQAAERAADGARLLPAMVGAQGTRRYFLAFQNGAELRATGGSIASWGELEAEGGRLRVTRFGALRELDETGSATRVLHAPAGFLERYRDFDVAGRWQEVNVSPDFPTTARLIMDLYPQSGGRPLDGVIAVDPSGLAALLEVTGPVAVDGWPEPVTAANVVDVAQRSSFQRYLADEQRASFVNGLVRSVWEAFTRADLGNALRVAEALGRATRTDHLLVYVGDPEAQQLVSGLGADGAVPAVEGDSLMVVDQARSATTADLFLNRRVRYDVTLEPSARRAALRGHLEVTLENGAPPVRIPDGVVPPDVGPVEPGENRTYLSLYTPFSGRSATLDGQPVELAAQPDLGRIAHSATVTVPARRSRTLRLDVAGSVALDAQGWYRLDLGHQPIVVPDQVDVSVAVPAGWRIADTRGLERTGSRHAVAHVRLDESRSLWVRVDRTAWAGFWHHLLH